MSTPDGIPHGLSRYTKYKCRCDVCRAASAAYQRQWRLNNPDKVKVYPIRDDQREKRRLATQRWREANPGKSVEISRRWREANPEQAHAKSLKWNRANPEVMRAANAKWRAAHRQEARDAGRAWRLANPGRARDAAKAWREAHPETVRFNNAKRRARKQAADNRRVSMSDWRRLCGRFNNCCAYCGANAVLTQDHIIPIVRGGRHSIGNLLPSCGPCNSSKGSKLLVEWRRAS